MKVILETTTNNLEIENIVKAMIFHEGEPYATSTQVAKYFGIRHDNLIRKIKSFDSFNALIDSSKLRSRIRIIRGKEYPYFELDADAFTFTCLSITGKKAERFKWAFIQAFKTAAAEALIMKVKAETNLTNENFFRLREETKRWRLCLTDAIRKLCSYAEEQRGHSYDSKCPYFKHFTNLAYKTIGISRTKAYKQKRDALDAVTLEKLETTERFIANEIESLIDFGIPYNSIYHMVKKRLKYWKDEVQKS